jgi:hypothetical protein
LLLEGMDDAALLLEEADGLVSALEVVVRVLFLSDRLPRLTAKSWVVHSRHLVALQLGHISVFMGMASCRHLH